MPAPQRTDGLCALPAPTPAGTVARRRRHCTASRCAAGQSSGRSRGCHRAGRSTPPLGGAWRRPRRPRRPARCLLQWPRRRMRPARGRAAPSRQWQTAAAAAPVRPVGRGHCRAPRRRCCCRVAGGAGRVALGATQSVVNARALMPAPSRSAWRHGNEALTALAMLHPPGRHQEPVFVLEFHSGHRP